MHAPARTFFITGTDTGSGKTLATLALMKAFKSRGENVGGMKPVASGCTLTGEGLVSEDAQLIRGHCSRPWPYSVINPLALAAPCSPNIAAVMEGREPNLAPILQAYTELRRSTDVLLVEGIGGWCTPFSERMTMGDVVSTIGMPAVMVVGIRLGCINHALLTQRAILADNVELAGWIANRVDPRYHYAMETVAFLKDAIGGAFLGEIPHLVNGLHGIEMHVNVLPLL